MDYQNSFKRYELKYLITKEQQKSLYIAMKEYMQKDKYEKSTVNNIYFDTDDMLLIRRSIDKPNVYKEKLRVRSYGTATENSTVFIEIKKKFKGVVYKRRIGLPLYMARDYLINKVPLDSSTQISKEIDYFMDLYKGIKPMAFISYEREAFYSLTDANFRMTFDENILSRDYDLSLSKGAYGDILLPKGMVLLEVKTALGLPRFLLDFLSENKIFKTTFSKYGTAYTKYMISKFNGGKTNVA